MRLILAVLVAFGVMATLVVLQPDRRTETAATLDGWLIAAGSLTWGTFAYLMVDPT